MATLRQIVNKAVEVKTAFDAVGAAQLARDTAASNAATADAALAAAQATLQTLTQELKTLINEP